MGGGDESFKKSGTVPFKWEVKPGVPKSPLDDQPPRLDHHRSLPATPRRLTPPPSAAFSTRNSGLGSHSFHSTTSLQLERHPVEPKLRAPVAHPLVVSAGCLLSPFFRRKWGRKKKVAHKASPEHSDGVSERAEITTLPRCSTSTRHSSFSSRRSMSSCQVPVRDPEWVGFGLF